MVRIRIAVPVFGRWTGSDMGNWTTIISKIFLKMSRAVQKQPGKIGLPHVFVLVRGVAISRGPVESQMEKAVWSGCPLWMHLTTTMFQLLRWNLPKASCDVLFFLMPVTPPAAAGRLLGGITCVLLTIILKRCIPMSRLVFCRAVPEIRRRSRLIPRQVPLFSGRWMRSAILV